jgi:integrase
MLIYRRNEDVEKINKLSKVKAFLDNYDAKKTRVNYRSSLIKFNSYLESKFGYNCDTVINLMPKKLNPYDLIRGFVPYLSSVREGITPNTINLYVAAIRSYFEFHDVDTHKFKRKVRLPKIVIEKEQAIDKKDLYQMLISCHNKRLKAFILLLISSGLRADSEACTLRNKDINFDVDPTELHIRGIFTKTKATRTAYITPEAKKFLLEFIAFRGETDPEQLIFSVYNRRLPKNVEETKQMSASIYNRLHGEFTKLLNVVNLDQKKDIGVSDYRRHCITFHSCRRFTSTVLEDVVGKGYHDFILGHNGYLNTYHTQKKEKVFQDYQRCIPYLTVLDKEFLEATGRSIEARLEEKDRSNEYLRQRIDKLEQVVQFLMEQKQPNTSSHD